MAALSVSAPYKPFPDAYSRREIALRPRAGSSGVSLGPKRRLTAVKETLYHPGLPTLRRMSMDEVLCKLPDEHSRFSTPCTASKCTPSANEWISPSDYPWGDIARISVMNLLVLRSLRGFNLNFLSTMYRYKSHWEAANANFTALAMLSFYWSLVNFGAAEVCDTTQFSLHILASLHSREFVCENRRFPTNAATKLWAPADTNSMLITPWILKYFRVLGRISMSTLHKR